MQLETFFNSSVKQGLKWITQHSKATQSSFIIYTLKKIKWHTQKIKPAWILGYNFYVFKSLFFLHVSCLLIGRCRKVVQELSTLWPAEQFLPGLWSVAAGVGNSRDTGSDSSAHHILQLRQISGVHWWQDQCAHIVRYDNIFLKCGCLSCEWGTFVMVSTTLFFQFREVRHSQSWSTQNASRWHIVSRGLREGEEWQVCIFW